MENKELHLSIISPSDVKLERDSIEEICDEFNILIAKEDIEIILHRYENYPPNYHEDPQTRFEAYHQLKNTDIIVAILWYRLGTVLIDKFKGKITKSMEVTGTEYEIEHAIFLKKTLWLYRKTDDEKFPLSESIKIGKQKENMEKFLLKIGIKLKQAVHSNHTFKEKEFKQLFRKNLQKELEKRYAIKIKLAKEKPINTQDASDSIHPNYLVGLYAFLALSIVMIFQFVESRETFAQETKTFVNIYSSLSLFILAIAIKFVPTQVEKYQNKAFKELFYALFFRALFIIFFAISLSIYFYLIILPLIRELFTP